MGTKKITIELSDELYEKIEKLAKKTKTPIYDPTVEDFIVEYLTTQFMFDSFEKINENMKDLFKNIDPNNDFLKSLYDEFFSSMSKANKEKDTKETKNSNEETSTKPEQKKYKS